MRINITIEAKFGNPFQMKHNLTSLLISLWALAQHANQAHKQNRFMFTMTADERVIGADDVDYRKGVEIIEEMEAKGIKK